MRKEFSHQFIQDYVNQSFDIGERAIQIINDNLMIYEDFEGHLDRDWTDLMGARNVYHYKMMPRPHDIEQVWRWLEKSVLPTVAFLKYMDSSRYECLLEEAKMPRKYQQEIRKQRQAEVEQLMAEKKARNGRESQ